MWTLVCHSLLQGTIKLTFADQPSLQKDHLDAYKPKLEIKVCIRSGVVCDVVWCGVVWCGVVWCGVYLLSVEQLMFSEHVQL